MKTPIKILIADDSETSAKLLKSILNGEPDMEVIGLASNGKQAVEMTYKLKPDLVTMDIHMPVMDGHYATRMIMSTAPVPIVVISSSVDKGEIPIAFHAIEEGAVSVIEKPSIANTKLFETTCREIITTIRAMADVKVVRRRRPLADQTKEQIFNQTIPATVQDFEIVALAASTGGPQALQTILSNLPVSFPLPILVIQHISSGFVHGLADWLKMSTLLNVTIASDGQILEGGTVYFAPDKYHLGVKRENSKLITSFSNDAPINSFRPSATYLFRSVAEVCGDHAIGCILTGMGSDGTEGLLYLRQKGGYTLAQDEKSCVVFGMPSVAIKLNAVKETLAVDQIATHLINKIRHQNSRAN